MLCVRNVCVFMFVCEVIYVLVSSGVGLASGDYECLCVSGVRALRHPRQVCVFVCAIVH